MSAPRCRATAKSTGARCCQYAVAGSTVCRFHGGAARQVRRRAAQRVALAKAAAALGEGGPHADPRDVLATATTLADRLMRAAAARLDTTITPEQAGALAELIRLATGVSAQAVAAGADEVSRGQRERELADRMAAGVLRVITHVLRSLGVEFARPEVRALVEAAARRELARSERRAVRSPGARALPPGQGSR